MSSTQKRLRVSYVSRKKHTHAAYRFSTNPGPSPLGCGMDGFEHFHFRFPSTVLTHFLVHSCFILRVIFWRRHETFFEIPGSGAGGVFQQRPNKWQLLGNLLHRRRRDIAFFEGIASRAVCLAGDGRGCLPLFRRDRGETGCDAYWRSTGRSKNFNIFSSFPRLRRRGFAEPTGLISRPGCKQVLLNDGSRGFARVTEAGTKMAQEARSRLTFMMNIEHYGPT